LSRERGVSAKKSSERTRWGGGGRDGNHLPRSRDGTQYTRRRTSKEKGIAVLVTQEMGKGGFNEQRWTYCVRGKGERLPALLRSEGEFHQRRSITIYRKSEKERARARRTLSRREGNRRLQLFGEEEPALRKRSFSSCQHQEKKTIEFEKNHLTKPSQEGFLNVNEAREEGDEGVFRSKASAGTVGE